MTDPHSTRVVFFLSTGRCGTQWVCKTLQHHYADLAETTHEPIRAAYHAKRYLRNDAAWPELEADAELAAHRGQIRKTLTQRHYIETGWPCFAALPWWIQTFGERMSIVHLVRHPVCNALSLTTQEMYGRNDWMSSMALTPSDPGVAQPELDSHWRRMTDYQKSLFFWTEVHQYAGELQSQYPQIPFLTVRFEDLFGPGDETLLELLAFLCLPSREPALAARRESHDIYRSKTAQADWQDVGSNHAVAQLAERYGYRLNDVSPEEIESRYFASVPERIRQSLRSLSRRWRRRLRSAS